MASSVIEKAIPAGVINCANMDIPSGGAVLIDHKGPILFYTDRGGLWSEGNASRALTTLAASTNITVSRVSSSVVRVANSFSYGANLIVMCVSTVSLSVE